MLRKLLTTLAALFLASATGLAGQPKFTICCVDENDLFVALKSAGIRAERHQTVEAAVEAAPPASPVLLLADDFPNSTLRISEELLARAKSKRLRLYIECCDSLPGLATGSARITSWERFVVSTDALGADLPKGRILSAHQCSFLPVNAPEPLIVVARVAGYNNAVYGIPASAKPILFAYDTNTLVATAKLSSFRKGRFAPKREWQTLWSYILGRLAGDSLISLTWESRTAPMYAPDVKLPRRFEHDALRSAAAWHLRSRLLVHETERAEIRELLTKGTETREISPAHTPEGDGRFGILEGYASNILPSGNQPQRTVIRADCQAESAMVLAMDWAQNSNRGSRTVASNLLDFVYFNSDLCKGGRGDPRHPAYGLIAWGSTTPAWTIANYGDDNARTMLSTILAGACLKTHRWDDSLLRALLANLRTTGKLGFRGDRIDMAALESNGWRHYHDAGPVNFSPHFESYNWACFLWAYKQTGHREFLDKTRTAIRLMMEAFPDKWRWNDNIERARMLLCLAWLARLEDTPEHRGWLRRVTDDLIAIQHASGALPERFRGTPGSHYQVPSSNEAYGTGETPLLQENGDPVSDQLYVSGFALLGLHEAAAVLKDPRVSAAEDRLAEYLCRIQIRSKELPYLEGTWFRAFDFLRWEPWASSGDAGWGAWSIEAGWAQAWTAAALALRAEQTTFWELSAREGLKNRLPEVLQEFK